MKRLLFIVLLVLSGLSGADEPPLFRANSKDLGYDTIDLDVTEVARGQQTAKLRIRGFHTRSAFGSRWLMCSYTALAIQRGFQRWAAYYPEPPDEELLLIFPASDSDDLLSLAGQQIDKARLTPVAPVTSMLALCSKVLKK